MDTTLHGNEQRDEREITGSVHQTTIMAAPVIRKDPALGVDDINGVVVPEPTASCCSLQVFTVWRSSTGVANATEWRVTANNGARLPPSLARGAGER